MAGIVFPPLISTSQYPYKVKQFAFSSGRLQRVGGTSTSVVNTFEIENETNTYWWIYLPASYHDSFYHVRFDPPREVPTQVTGAVAEALSLIIMRDLFQATNIYRITTRPSSRTADFEMDIIENGKRIHALVESKGSNRSHRTPPRGVVLDGTVQLRATSRVKQHFSHPTISGYLIITSYPSRTCFVIKVF